VTYVGSATQEFYCVASACNTEVIVTCIIMVECSASCSLWQNNSESMQKQLFGNIVYF